MLQFYTMPDTNNLAERLLKLLEAYQRQDELKRRQDEEFLREWTKTKAEILEVFGIAKTTLEKHPSWKVAVSTEYDEAVYVIFSMTIAMRTASLEYKPDLVQRRVLVTWKVNGNDGSPTPTPLEELGRRVIEGQLEMLVKRALQLS